VSLSGSDRSPASTTTHPTRASLFRVHARHLVRLHALVVHLDAGWQRHGAVENLGLGGACVVIDEPLARGDAITVSFTAPTLWDPLQLRARVVWAAAGGGARRAGVAFDQPTADAVFALYELIVALGFE
jgi:hypothetical protein